MRSDLQKVFFQRVSERGRGPRLKTILSRNDPLPPIRHSAAGKGGRYVLPGHGRRRCLSKIFPAQFGKNQSGLRRSPLFQRYTDSRPGLWPVRSVQRYEWRYKLLVGGQKDGKRPHSAQWSLQWKRQVGGLKKTGKKGRKQNRTAVL